MKSFISKSVIETKRLANKILEELKGKNVICLYGELGAGKTTFVQGLAKRLGIKKRIISPTFVLVREYKIATSNKPSSRAFGPSSCRGAQAEGQQVTRNQNLQLETCNLKHLIHIDCYRIDSEEDIKSIDLREIWDNTENLVVIEWAEKVRKILPKSRIDIKFEYIEEKKRKITIKQWNNETIQ